MDEEIQIDDIPQSTIPPKTTEKKVGDDETGCNTLVIHDDFWEETHPCSPRSTQIPPTPAATEILTGSDGKTFHEESSQESDASAEDNAATNTTTSSSNKQIPQAEENPQTEENAHSEEHATAPNTETAIVVVNTETTLIVATPQEEQHNLQPQQNQPFSKRTKFQKEDFYEEHMYFTGENPYDKLRIRHRKFWTRNQLNYYASVLCGRNKIFQHTHIPHCDMEEIPCFAPVLNILHEARLLPFCTNIGDWKTDIILQFYATLHISGDPKDVNTWVLDWMTQHMHCKAPATEFLRALPISITSEDAILMYDERELPNRLMKVLMKPLAKDQPPRTQFLVQDLKYEPRTVYRILSYAIAPLKGHDDEEDVIGIMKNIPFNVIHGILMNLHYFFLRTLADNALSPFELKIYAPWIMRFIINMSDINYLDDFQNHLGYLPSIKVIKKSFEPIEGKGKSVIDEGNRPLDGQL
ncbi:hypothetical protein ZWY2020_057659 [Hordeum vulgare]|nr:hypothetical protein ZWY2020_057659 [Hordeum vulgare]